MGALIASIGGFATIVEMVLESAEEAKTPHDNRIPFFLDPSFLWSPYLTLQSAFSPQQTCWRLCD